MTREDIINQGRPTEPNCFETDREERWYNIGLYDGATANQWHDVSQGDLPLNKSNMLTQLNELRDRAHATARAKGFYDDPTSELSVLSLIIEEIGEAISADRRGRRAKMARYKKKLNNGLPQKLAYNSAIRGSLEEELADIAIRLLDYAGYRSIDLTITDEEFNELNKSKEMTNKTFSLLGAPVSVILWQLSRELWQYVMAEEDFQVKYRILVHVVFLISLAEFNNIDLFLHIKEKMAYNECRPRKYNKKY